MLRSCQIIFTGELLSGNYVRHLETYVFICGRIKKILKVSDLFIRDDGLRLWTAISDFIRKFIAIFYRSDDDVCKDNEIQSWVREIHENGLPC